MGGGGLDSEKEDVAKLRSDFWGRVYEWMGGYTRQSVCTSTDKLINNFHE